MASGFVTWQCSSSDFQRFLIACSNHHLVRGRWDRPTIAKRADDRPESRHQPGVTGYGGYAAGSGGPSLVKHGGAKRDAPDVTWLQEKVWGYFLNMGLLYTCDCANQGVIPEIYVFAFA